MTDSSMREATRRRTFAVISHPDAGKSTLTEALLLHARVISQAGATHGKAGRHATVSDWMEMEKARGISISSSSLQFHHGDTVLNLVDTPGHADFSEDTYRVLTAVDSAVMLLDAAKGLETQTMRLFEVCRSRGIPIITVINKWDRPGHDALALLDEIESRTALRPTPITWPVGIAGQFHGVIDRDSGDFVRFSRTPGGSTLSGSDRMSPAAAHRELGPDWEQSVDEVELLAADGYNHDQATFESQQTTPVLFTAAALNFGVGHLLDTIVALAPAARDRQDDTGHQRSVSSDFSAHVFKVQAGMNRNHRDRLAFARVCSGCFHRGDVVTHEPSGRAFATKYAHTVFGRDRDTVEIAYPGDIIGLVNAGDLRAGDTLYKGTPVRFPRIPPFAPEHFRAARVQDLSRSKQFQRGMSQLDQEGVIQVLHSEHRTRRVPILGAVGPMQFEVVSQRMEHEFGTPVHLDPLPYTTSLQTHADDAAILARRPGTEVAVREDGTHLALFTDPWQIRVVRREYPNIFLEPIGTAPTTHQP